MIKENHIFTDSDKHVYFLIKELKTFYIILKIWKKCSYDQYVWLKIINTCTNQM